MRVVQKLRRFSAFYAKSHRAICGVYARNWGHAYQVLREMGIRNPHLTVSLVEVRA